MRPDFRLRENEGGVHVHDPVPRLAHAAQRFGEKHRRIRPLPLGIRRRKKRPDVGSSDGSQQRIGYSMQQDVSIRMPAKPLSKWDLHATDFQWNSTLEFMRVPAIANFHFVPPVFWRE